MPISRMPCLVASWIVSILLGSSNVGCVTKPAPSPEARACWVGILDSETAMLLRAQSHKLDVKAGDLIQTPECARQMSQDLLNETYSLTK